MSTVAHLPEHILQRQSLAHQLPWLQPAVAYAKQQLADQQHYRGESYRYSRIPHLLEMPWLYELSPMLSGEPLKPLQTEHHSFIFVDGIFAPQWSSLPKDTNWHYQLLSDVMRDCPPWLKKHVSKLPTHWSEQLNLLLTQQGIVIEIPSCTTLDKPIDIIHYYRQSTPSTTHTRHAIHLHPHAKAIVNEYHIGLSTAASLATHACIIELDEQAKLHYSLIRHGNPQFYQLQHMAIALHEKSELQSFYADLNAKLLRTDLHAHLHGNHAKWTANALFLATAREQIEQQWHIFHHGRDTISHTKLKGIADDEGQVICRGRIEVLPSAIKTDASLYNPNLLLSPRAQIDSLPELAISQDDVACAHGATVGQIDEQALFYLQSRGIALTDARQMLTSAFIQSELSALPTYLYRYLVKQLPFHPMHMSLDMRLS